MSNEKTLALLKHQEGYRQFVYDDATGKPTHGTGKLTIGYGLNLEQRGLTEDEASYILNNDIISTTDRLGVLVPFFNRLDPVRQAILISMAINLGMSGLMGFSGMLSYMDARKWGQATEAMANSLWAKQVPARFEELSGMMAFGIWPDFLKGVL